MNDSQDERENAAVITAVLEGRFTEIPGMLRGITDARRASLLTELESITPPRNGHNVFAPSFAYCLAGIACQSDVAVAANWLAGQRFRLKVAEQLGAALVDLLEGWPPNDLIALARAAEPDLRWQLPVITALVRAAGTPLGISDAGILDWFDAHVDWCQEATPEAMRSCVLAPEALPRLPKLDGLGRTIGEALRWSTGQWAASTLAVLAQDGHLDRHCLLSGTFDGLLRSASRVETRGYLALMEALDPDADELAPRADDLVTLAVSAFSPASKVALRHLRKLADTGRLTTDQVEGCVRGVLGRSEKTLADAALTLLGREVRRDATRARALAPLLADAFVHSSADVQDKAVKLAGRLMGRLDEDLLGELAAAVVHLPPDRRRQAADLFGGSAAEPAPARSHDHEDLLPEPAAPPRFPAPATDAQEVAAELGVVLSARTPDPVAVERVLDGLVRLACRQRHVLAKAVAPVLQSHGHRTVSHGLTEVSLVAVAVEGRTTAEALDELLRSHVDAFVADARKADDHERCGHRVFDAVLSVRVMEAARRIAAGDPPPLPAVHPVLGLRRPRPGRSAGPAR